MRAHIEALEPTIKPLGESRSVEAGLLRVATRSIGLSLDDRASLALARQYSVPALTADRAWKKLDLGF